MASSDNLTDLDLSRLLKEYGISSPVTASTRGILLKKLNNIMSKKEIPKTNDLSSNNLKKSFSPTITSSSKKLNKRKNNFALHNFSSDEEDIDDIEFSGPKTRLRSFRNSNDSSFQENNNSHKHKLTKSYNNYELPSTNNTSLLDNSVSKNYTPIITTPLNRGRLLRRKRPEVYKPEEYDNFSDSDVDDIQTKSTENSKRYEPDNPCNYYKNFKLFDMKDDKRNLPIVSKNSQRGTEIRIIHNKNSHKIPSPDEIVSHEIPSYQSILPNGRSLSDSSKGSSFEENTWSQSVSIGLLILFICFFIFVGFCYLNIQTSFPSPYGYLMTLGQVFSQGNVKLDGSKYIGTSRVKHMDIYNKDAVPKCFGSEKKICLSDTVYATMPQLVQLIEDYVVPELLKHGSLYQCGQKENRYMVIDDIATLFEVYLPEVSKENIKEGLYGFAKYVSQNHDFGLEVIWDDKKSEPVGMAVTPLPNEYLCYIFLRLYGIIYSLLAIVTGIVATWLVYQLILYRKRILQEEEQKSFEMVEEILEMLENLCVVGGKNFIAVNHIRDCLIPPRERKNKAALWNRAVKFIDEHDSRVYREIRLVGGDECDVWRWVAGAPRSPIASSSPKETSNVMEKSWQGKAFDSVETPQNFPTVSPTACLKVRKMFVEELMFGKNWPQRVQDNLLEKCEPAKILHVAVDKESKEGCVYVKCASQHDAGIAFRALHGTWFDGNLVTVKYLREEKYHYRFPASRNLDSALKHDRNNIRMERR